MLRLKSGLFIAAALASAAFALEARAVTPVLPPHVQTIADQDGAASVGPTTGGGDTSYISAQPPKPGLGPAKPGDPASSQAIVPAPVQNPAAAATTPPAPPAATAQTEPSPQPSEPVKAAEPVAPAAPPAPAAPEVVPTTPPSTIPAATEKAPDTPTPATPVPTVSPAQPPTPEAPVQAATPTPVTPETPVPAATPAPQPAPEVPVQAATPTPETPVPAAVPTPQPVAPEAPVQAATPTPVTPETPVPAAVPVTPPSVPAPPVQAATPPVSAPPSVAIQPQLSQPAPVVGAQDQKPKQQLAKKKPVHKPDVVVRNVLPRVPVYRGDDSDTIYESGPVPPLPIGRRRVVVEADNGYDGGDYVVIRRYRPCERRFLPGFWLFHREARCY